jgi:hypothetical protein
MPLAREQQRREPESGETVTGLRAPLATGQSFPRPRLLRFLDPRESHSRPRRGVLRTCQDDREDDRRAAGRSHGAEINYLRWLMFPIKGNPT